jgi:ubiquinone/menaquinone biosynthesis C-methylase UbiE
MVILLLLVSNNVSVYAQEGVRNREDFRKKIPVDELMIRLEDSKREQSIQPERVIDVLGVKKGETVADVGAGTGYFSFRLAALVGVEGKVYAVEIEDELLEYIRNKMDKNKVTNIIPIKSSESDPKLPPASCNKILLANTYGYLSDPVTFMKTIRKALKPGGLVAIIDLDEDKVKEKRKSIKKTLPVQTKLRFASEVIDEMKRAGFVLRESHDFLDSRHFLIFSVIE